jgi:hypothetical protein
MAVVTTFLNALLSGAGTARPKLKAALSFNSNGLPVYISDVFPLQSISLSAQGGVNYDTGNYRPDYGAYLACNDLTFSYIGADFTIPPNQSPYLYTYIDNGNPTMSRVLTRDELTSPAIYGKTTCSFLSGRVLSLVDGPASDTGLYRNFRLNLLKGAYGNLLSANWCAALVVSGYTPDLAKHTTYADISSYVVALTSIQQKDFIIQFGAFYKNVNYVSFGTVPASADPSHKPITSIVGFLSGTTPTTSPLAFVYSNLNTQSLIPVNNTIIWNINDSILFSLS